MREEASLHRVVYPTPERGASARDGAWSRTSTSQRRPALVPESQHVEPVLAAMLGIIARAARESTRADVAAAALTVGAPARSQFLVEIDGPRRMLPPSTVAAAARYVRPGRLLTLPDARRGQAPAWRAAGRGGARALLGMRLQVRGSSGCIVLARRSGRPFAASELYSLGGVTHYAGLAVGAVEEAMQRERQRVARRVHDGLAQSLTAFVLADRRLAATLEEQHRDVLLSAVHACAMHMVEEVRDLIHFALDGTSSEEPDLMRLPALLEELRGSELAVSYTSNVDVRRLPRPVSICLYNIAREALVNVVRHAEASRVKVSLWLRSASVELTIDDDGRGFVEGRQTSGSWNGFGLRMTRERVAEAKGTVDVQSTPGQGTLVTVRLPLPDAVRPRARGRRAALRLPA